MSTCSTETPPPRRLTLLAVIAIFGGVLALWVATPVVLWRLYPGLADRGLVGDGFGVINALFSGLAFAGVVVAILLQREELELQRLEIAANRAELARAATAQEESREALRKTVYVQVFKTVMDTLQTPEVRSARGVVMLELRDTPMREWTQAQIRAAEIVCYTYDTVGIMARREMIPVDWIADSWGDSLRRTWTTLEPLVHKYREERQSQEYWDDFQWLAAEARRYQQAKSFE